MTLSTSTVTLAPGSSRTYSLAPGEAVTVATEPNCYVTVTETPDVITTADQWSDERAHVDPPVQGRVDLRSLRPGRHGRGGRESQPRARPRCL
jgi:hypothetical protein